MSEDIRIDTSPLRPRGICQRWRAARALRRRILVAEEEIHSGRERQRALRAALDELERRARRAFARQDGR